MKLKLVSVSGPTTPAFWCSPFNQDKQKNEKGQDLILASKNMEAKNLESVQSPEIHSFKRQKRIIQPPLLFKTPNSPPLPFKISNTLPSNTILPIDTN